jgi:hypothetical protein
MQQKSRQQLNNPDAANRAMRLQFHIVPACRPVADLERSAEVYANVA